MKRKLSIISICSLLLWGNASALDWLNMIRRQHSNLHTVQNAFEKSNNAQVKNNAVKGNDSIEEEDGNYEQFKRGEWMMRPRTYPTGDMPDYATVIKDFQQYK